jgi:hypothetical protein
MMVGTGPYCSLGTTGSVPRAYERIEGRKNRKQSNEKIGKFNKIKYKTSKLHFFLKTKIPL